MDLDALRGISLLALILGAGLATFALAGLVGGIVAAVADRARRPRGGTWWLVAGAGLSAGPVVLVGLIVVAGALAPVGQVPLLYPTWVGCALAGGLARLAMAARSTRSAPVG